MAIKYWLFKTDPEDFSWKSLKNSEDQRTFWDGVRNYQARNFLRDDVKIGDFVLFYESNSNPTAVYGTCKVVKQAYADHTQFDQENPHYYPSALEDEPVWFMVDIQLDEEFKKPVTLSDMKKNPKLGSMKVLQKGNRLSITPVTEDEFNEVKRMGNSE